MTQRVILGLEDFETEDGLTPVRWQGFLRQDGDGSHDL